MAHLQVNMRLIIHQELIDGETIVDRQCGILSHHEVLKGMRSTSLTSHHSITNTQSSRVSSKFFLCSLVHRLSRHSLKDVAFSKSVRTPHSLSAEQTTSSSFICSTSDSLLSEIPLVNHFYYIFQVFRMGGPNYGALGMTFSAVRGLQAVSLIAIIGMTANFISQMVSSSTAPPRVLVGTLSVVSSR